MSELSSQDSETRLSLNHIETGKEDKNALRVKYEAQAYLIRKQIGDIPQILSYLQLSQRALAQLMLVDPSAVSRWIQKPASIPPSVMRALQWYMALQEKIPGLTPSYFVGRQTQSELARLETKASQENSLLREEIHLLRKMQKRIIWGLIFTLILSLGLGILALILDRD
ncbi:MAG: hypothetical protein WCH11_05510 [Bdellovibrio sp.]